MVDDSYRKILVKIVAFYRKTDFLASRRTSRGTSQICMGRLKRSRTEAIWYVSNERGDRAKLQSLRNRELAKTFTLGKDKLFQCEGFAELEISMARLWGLNE